MHHSNECMAGLLSVSWPGAARPCGQRLSTQGGLPWQHGRHSRRKCQWGYKYPYFLRLGLQWVHIFEVGHTRGTYFGQKCSGSHAAKCSKMRRIKCMQLVRITWKYVVIARTTSIVSIGVFRPRNSSYSVYKDNDSHITRIRQEEVT